MPVGALVFARSAVAGDLWFPGSKRAELLEAAVVGSRRQSLYPAPPAGPACHDMYDRQNRAELERGVSSSIWTSLGL